MTPPRAPGGSAATRPPLLLLALIYLVPFVAAAATPASDFLGPQGDVGLYLEKARAVASGLVPYRDVPFEYPPFALLPMVVPSVLWPFGAPPLDQYAWLFAGEQAVLLLALALVLGRIVGLGGLRETVAGGDPSKWQRVVAVRLLVLAAGAALALTWRFDLFPTLLAAISLWAVLANRPAAAGAALGAGALAKLFPVVLGPALAVGWLAPLDRRRVVRFGGAAFVTVALGLAPFLALAGLDALVFLAYQAQRGLQIESLGGGMVLLGGLISGTQIPLSSPFSAQEVTGAAAMVILSALPPLTVGGLALLGWLGWRRARAKVRSAGRVEPSTIVHLATASVLVLLVTSKVFSIQYVVWLVPFAALLPTWQFRLAAVIVALTIPIHPVLYDALVRQEALPILVLNLRNVLVAALLGWVVADVARPAGLEPTTFRSAT